MKRTIPIFLTLALMLSATGCSTSAAAETATENYANALFDDSYVHTIDIQIPEESWADLLENPMDKTKYESTVVIDGNTVKNVSVATKGNSSLSQVAGSDSNRYSFKVNFGKFAESQTYGGLDKLNLQNIFSDATYMKDYLAYEIMKESGAVAPLTSYVSLTINGEAFGLYLALEDIDDSFLERNFGTAYGQLYKPETEMLGNMNQKGMNNGERPNGMDFPEGAEPPEGMEPFKGAENKQNKVPPTNQSKNSDQNDENRETPKFDMGGTAKGADLVYTDDEIASYSDIFDNAQTDPTEEDKERLISALKQLSTGESLESSVNVDGVLRYFVAHNFVLNGDSYTGSMLHNYGLYEENGILSMVPWDYNLAFGGFHMNGDATAIVNTGIDSPLNTQNSGNRPMWEKVIADEENLETYHEYFNQLITNYFESGRFESTVNRISTLIRPYVENDPTAWYSVDEFDTAVKTITQFCLLRAESIRNQLGGTLAATTDAQKETDMVDASSIDISAMGSQGMGRNRDDMEGRETKEAIQGKKPWEESEGSVSEKNEEN